MSNATYKSFLFDPTDTLEERQAKLYLGMMSCGEDAYTLGAAIGECRKTLASLTERLAAIDQQCAEIKEEYFSLKGAFKREAQAEEK